MSIFENIEQIKHSIPNGVSLVAVSKYQPIESLKEAYAVGHRIFGENKVQEMKEKHQQMPADVQWHFIGHLQKNKIKYIAPYISLIQSIDSYNLLQEVNKEAKKNNRIINCLLQFHIAKEETKYGLNLQEAEQILSDPSFINLKNICIKGVMGMATYTTEEEVVRSEFQNLKSIFDILKQTYFSKTTSFSEISMGMSSDYLLAIEEGSTIVRIGTAIFGDRK